MTNLQYIYDSTAPQAKGKLILATETDANIESQKILKRRVTSLTSFPYVLQLNKRDLPNVSPTYGLSQKLLRKGEPVLRPSQ